MYFLASIGIRISDSLLIEARTWIQIMAQQGMCGGKYLVVEDEYEAMRMHKVHK